MHNFLINTAVYGGVSMITVYCANKGSLNNKVRRHKNHKDGGKHRLEAMTEEIYYQQKGDRTQPKEDISISG